MVYNLTGIVQNGTDIVNFTQGVNNTLMGGWLGTLLVIGIGVILYMGFVFGTDNNRLAATASLFICTILSILLMAMGLIGNFWVVLVFSIFSAISVAAWSKT